MSPTAFKDTLESVLTLTSKSHDYCLLIRQNRHLPHKTIALDTLQSSFVQGIKDLQADFNTLRRAIGSRMDLGDEQSRAGLVRCSREMESIKQRLGDVAFRRDEATDGRPGFRELHRRWTILESDISAIIESLGRRLTSAPVQPSQPPPSPRPSRDEVKVSAKEYQRMVDHMRNSWVEKFVAGRVCFVNVADEKRITFELPEGFVHYLPTVPGRTKSWERTSMPKRQDSWSGW